jgi:uncharacterized membrane protein
MRWVSGFLQWLHVLAAVLAVGGVFFLRFILCPALKKLPADQVGVKPQLLKPVAQRFRVVIHSSIAVLLLTGIYRLAKSWHLLKGWQTYQTLMGVKILLAAILFTIAFKLTKPGDQPNYFQRNRDVWLLANFVLGAVIILLSATLRRLWDFPH